MAGAGDFDRLPVFIREHLTPSLDDPAPAIRTDDPVFDPILEFIAKQNRTLYAHIAEPDSSWKALDPSSPDYGYDSQKENQAWYMYLHPERPSKERILTARDRMLAKHPTLRVVGCHLGSMETDVDEIAKRFDRYPNFAVDTAARVSYLMLQPREKVRAFLLKYQNRVLYGTDLDLLPWSNPEKTLKHWEAEYARDWKFFATDEMVEYNQVLFAPVKAGSKSQIIVVK